MKTSTKLIIPAFAALAFAGASTVYSGTAQSSRTACESCTQCATEETKAVEEKQEAARHRAPYTIALGLGGYSPVSYLERNRAEPGSPRYAATHESVTYFFTSARQKTAFEKAPERYMPAYGGFCAFGCTVEQHFVPDPTSFKIIDGRVHMFLKNDEVDAKALWDDGNQKELKKKADQFYEKEQTNRTDKH